MESNLISRAIGNLYNTAPKAPADRKSDRALKKHNAFTGVKGEETRHRSVLEAIEDGRAHMNLIGQPDADAIQQALDRDNEGMNPCRPGVKAHKLRQPLGSAATNVQDIQIFANMNLDRFVIGRDIGSNIRLDDPSISSHHASFIRKGNVFWIEQLDDQARITVNGHSVIKQRLKHRDLLEIGNYRFLFMDRERAHGRGWEHTLIALEPEPS